MPRLTDLNGAPMDWATLHARCEAWYAARPPETDDAPVKFTLVPTYLCAWPGCNGGAVNNHWCSRHEHAPRLLRAYETVSA